MNIAAKAVIMSIISLCALPAFSQGQAQKIQKLEINIWDGPAPGCEAAKQRPDLPFEYVTPKLTVMLPPENERNGAFVLVIPGGGYMYCSAVGEGFDIATWLNKHGIAAGVVQYRRNMFQEKDKSLTRIYNPNVALEDSARSMQIVRSHAAEWKIKPDKIGAIGFSAGGHIVATMGVHPEKADPNAQEPLKKFTTRPDFMILAYPLISMSPPWAGAIWRDNLLGKDFKPEDAEYYSCQKHVTADTPPSFIVCTADDFTLEDATAMEQAMKAKRLPCEMHIFEKGKHGYGMMNNGSAVTKLWPVLLEEWLKNRGALPQTAAAK